MGRSAERPPRDLSEAPSGLTGAGLAHRPLSTTAVPGPRFPGPVSPAADPCPPLALHHFRALAHGGTIAGSSVDGLPSSGPSVLRDGRTGHRTPPRAARRLMSAPLRGRGCNQYGGGLGWGDKYFRGTATGANPPLHRTRGKPRVRNSQCQIRKHPTLVGEVGAKRRVRGCCLARVYTPSPRAPTSLTLQGARPSPHGRGGSNNRRPALFLRSWSRL